jgi:hypothetical protein
MSVNRRELIAEWRTDFDALPDCVTYAASALHPINTSSSGYPNAEGGR